MITLASKLGGYCNDTSLKYCDQWNTYEEEKNEQTVVINLLHGLHIIFIMLMDTYLALRENMVVVFLKTKL